MVGFYIYGQLTGFDIANAQITYQRMLAHISGERLYIIVFLSWMEYIAVLTFGRGFLIAMPLQMYRTQPLNCYK